MEQVLLKLVSGDGFASFMEIRFDLSQYCLDEVVICPRKCAHGVSSRHLDVLGEHAQRLLVDSLSLVVLLELVAHLLGAISCDHDESQERLQIRLDAAEALRSRLAVVILLGWLCF